MMMAKTGAKTGVRIYKILAFVQSVCLIGFPKIHTLCAAYRGSQQQQRQFMCVLVYSSDTIWDCARTLNSRSLRLDRW